MSRDDQFKIPKRKVSARRLRIESHPTDLHKGILYSLVLYLKIICVILNKHTNMLLFFFRAFK